MSTKNTYIKTKPNLTELEGNRGIVRITPKFQKMIDYMHVNYPGDEWSGIMVYIADKFDLDKQEDFEFIPKFFIPMDLGTSAYTEFDYDGNLALAYDRAEELGISLEEIKIGFIHSHHSMGAYFSWTDKEELYENSKQAGVYLSLVVDTKANHVAKLAIPAQVQIVKTYTIKDYEGKPSNFFNEKKATSVVTFDLEVFVEEVEMAVPSWFNDRFEELKELEEIKAKKKKEKENQAWNSRDWKYSKTSSNGSTSTSKTPTASERAEKWIVGLVQELTNIKYMSIKAALNSAEYLEYPKLKGRPLQDNELDALFMRAYIEAYDGKPSDIQEYWLHLSQIFDVFEEFPRPKNSPTTYSVFDCLYDHLSDLVFQTEALMKNGEAGDTLKDSTLYTAVEEDEPF